MSRWSNFMRELFGEAPLPERGTLLAKSADRPPHVIKPAPPQPGSHGAARFRGVLEVREAIAQLRLELDGCEALLPEGEPPARTWEELQHRFERLSVQCKAVTGRCRLGARAAHKSLDGALP